MGMLDAACPGEVFTSPTPDQMLAATKAVNGGAGVLHIVKNYTGDILNFEMAAELAGAEGIAGRGGGHERRRGRAGQPLHGRAARRGRHRAGREDRRRGGRGGRRTWPTVAELCRRVNADGRSMGMALTSCTVPAAGKPTFELADDEMEIGIGIHGEPGRERHAARAGARRGPAMLAEPILDGPALRVGRRGARLRQRHGRHAADRAVHRLQRAAHAARRGTGSRIARNLVGSYITSLEMAGCSITLLKLDDELTRLWDAPVQTAGLRWGA